MSSITHRMPAQTFTLDGGLRLESGVLLPEAQLAWRSWGSLNAAADNAVVVCHALTGSADADDWWAPLFGPGQALDAARDFIVCSNTLGSSLGSTGPSSSAPDGRRWGSRFPSISVRDQVRAQIALADALGIKRIRLVVGGSLGGLQVLEWALLDPARVEAIASVAASARHSIWCQAWSEAQRLALAADPQWHGGDYDPAAPPLQGLAAARSIAMISYRSAGSLQQRFAHAGNAHGHEHSSNDGVHEWLGQHGDRLAHGFDAASYICLLDAMDRHDVGRDRGGLQAALACVRQPALVVSIPEDLLYVPEDQHALAEALPFGELVILDSPHGHDGFLIDAAALNDLLLAFRRRVTLADSHVRRQPLNVLSHIHPRATAVARRS